MIFTDTMCLISGPTSHNGKVLALPSSLRAGSPQSMYLLTKSQEGMWIEFLADPSSTKYNLTLEWDLQRRASVVPSIEGVLKG